MLEIDDKIISSELLFRVSSVGATGKGVVSSRADIGLPNNIMQIKLLH